MRGGRPSLTATIVALGRGAAGADPMATRLVPRRLARFARPGFPGASRLSLVNLMRLRTVALDAAVSRGVRDGIEQLVILGAGLDARAWRLAELSRTIVFEVDHPSTQRYKRSRLEDVAPKARDVRLVGVDFEKDDLSAALVTSGHDPHARTTWLWEGVVPYLTLGAVEETLDTIRSRSADGSLLGVTYVARMTPSRRPLRVLGLELGLHLLGEPFHCILSPEQMRRMLAERQFVVEDDASYPELATRLSLPRPRLDVIACERVLVATKRSNGAAS